MPVPVPVPVDPPEAALRDSRELLGDPKALGERAGNDGCLFVRQLIPVEFVTAAARRVEAACEARGFLVPQAKAVSYHDPAWVSLQAELLPASDVQRLGNHPAIWSVLAAIFGCTPMRAGADIIRIAFPHAPPTLPHQDAHYLRAAPTFWIAWLPLVSLTLGQGPLAIAPGSHKGGLRAHRGRELDDLAAEVTPSDRFVASPLEPGDVLFFSALTLHRALDNVSDRPRLSVDFRFRPVE